MIKASLSRTALFLTLLGYFGYALSGENPTKEDVSTNGVSMEDVSTEDAAITGNFEAGEERYKKSCVNCHGAGGKGVASYPKISGQEISFTKSRLETYRDGIKVGPNSSLMIMMAKPLTDEEIANLARYLKEVTN